MREVGAASRMTTMTIVRLILAMDSVRHVSDITLFGLCTNDNGGTYRQGTKYTRLKELAVKQSYR
jgi:hypothetical protein